MPPTKAEEIIARCHNAPNRDALSALLDEVCEEHFTERHDEIGHAFVERAQQLGEPLRITEGNRLAQHLNNQKTS